MFELLRSGDEDVSLSSEIINVFLSIRDQCCSEEFDFDLLGGWVEDQELFVKLNSELSGRSENHSLNSTFILLDFGENRKDEGKRLS